MEYGTYLRLAERIKRAREMYYKIADWIDILRNAIRVTPIGVSGKQLAAFFAF